MLTINLGPLIESSIIQLLEGQLISNLHLIGYLGASLPGSVIEVPGIRMRTSLSGYYSAHHTTT